MLNPFSVHLHIRIPTLCRTVEVDSNPGETLDEIKSRLLSSFSILDPEDWNFFAMGENYVQLSGSLECNKIAFIHAEMLFLSKLETRPITIFYYGKAKEIAIGLDSPLSSICPILISMFHISDEESYFFMDPITYTIQPMDLPTEATSLVFKPFELKDRSYLFRTDGFPEKMKNTSLMLVSKVLLKSPIKTLITNLKLQKCELNILDISEDKITRVYDSFASNTTPNLSPDESSTMLFTLMTAFEVPLLPKELHKYVKEICSLKNQSEIFKKLYILLTFLPMSSHCLLLELCQAISPSIFEAVSQDEIFTIMHEILFKHPLNQDNGYELFFVRFLLYFGQYLMHAANLSNLKKVQGNRLAISGNKEGTPVFYSVYGKENEAEAEPFEFDIDIEDVHSFCVKIEEPIHIYPQIKETNDKINEFMNAMQQAKQLLEGKPLLLTRQSINMSVHYITAIETVE